MAISPITTVETDNPQVALIVAAHNVASALLEAPGSEPTNARLQQQAAAYGERFTQVYQALAAATGLSVPAAPATGASGQTPPQP